MRQTLLEALRNHAVPRSSRNVSGLSTAEKLQAVPWRNNDAYLTAAQFMLGETTGCARRHVTIPSGQAILKRRAAHVDTQEIVYTDTWHLAANKPFGSQRQAAPEVAPYTSPYRCDFGGLTLPIIDYHVSEPDRTPVRVLVSDDPSFFPLLADSDRQHLLLIFAVMLLETIRQGMQRFQYGFSVDVLDDDVVLTRFVEYHVAMIKTDFSGEAAPPRYVANIWSGPPPSKLRRLLRVDG